MRLAGSVDMAGSAEELFEQLLDPRVLSACIPGCEAMREVEPGVYDTTVKAGVGVVKGRFEARVTVSEVVRPESYRLAVEGKSAVGHMSGSAAIRLEPLGAGTRIHYEGEHRVAGLIASVGGRLIDSVAKKVARDFFDRLAVEVSAST